MVEQNREGSGEQNVHETDHGTTIGGGEVCCVCGCVAVCDCVNHNMHVNRVVHCKLVGMICIHLVMMFCKHFINKHLP